MCVKEFENTSLVCGSNRDLETSDNPTPAPAAEPDFLQERAVLFDFLAKTIDSEDSEDREVDFVCSNCKHPPKEGEELKMLLMLSYNSLLQRPVPEERLGLLKICLFNCGKDGGL